MNTIEAIKSLFLTAGTSWILWFLAALSVASLAIALERWMYFRRSECDLKAMAERLHEMLATKKIDEAQEMLLASPSAASRIAAAGLRLADHGTAAAEKAMQSRMALERENFEKRLAFLGTLGNNAPFIGLFGTVIGVIQAFEELGHGAAGHGDASAAAHVASAGVMTAIAEALVATAVGIAVALPAVALFNYLTRRAETILAGADVLSNLVLAYLSSEKR